MNVPGPGTWLGTTSSDWSLPANWSDEKIPGSTTNVNIPIGSPNYPIINALDATANDITIAPGAGITLADFASFQIKGNVTNSGTFDASAAGTTVYFSGTNPQIIPGGQYFNLTIGGATKTLSADATVSTYLFFFRHYQNSFGQQHLNPDSRHLAQWCGCGKLLYHQRHRRA